MPNLFDSLFTQTTSSVNPIFLLLALGTSLLLGLALAKVYCYRTLYTKEFAASLILLPSLMSFVIFLVNGSLGTSIAVAGTFSLIRFRSATSGSRELLAIFFSMIIGLATGSGFLVLAIVFTVIVLTIWFLIDNKLNRRLLPTSRHLSLTYKQGEHATEDLEASLQTYCDSYRFISLKSYPEQGTLNANYEITLTASVTDINLIKALQNHLQVSDLSLSTMAKKKKNL